MAAFFTIKLDSHMTGQFLMAHKMENATLEASTLVMRFEISSTQLSQNRPFQLVTKTEQANNFYREEEGAWSTFLNHVALYRHISVKPLKSHYFK